MWNRLLQAAFGALVLLVGASAAAAGVQMDSTGVQWSAFGLITVGLTIVILAALGERTPR